MSKLLYRNAFDSIGHAQGIWLLHGDDPLLSQHLLDHARKAWRSQGIERQRIDLSSASDWHDALDALGNLSLFANQMVVEVHGNHKPDAALQKKLADFAQQPDRNLLLINMDKQDSAAQKTKFFQLIENSGTVISLSITDPREQQKLLASIAKNLGLQLSPAAWAELQQHTQNNLLAAQQALLRLASLHPAEQIADVDDLQPALVEQSRFSVFELGDAALLGQAEKVVQILQFLQESAEPPSLVLWTLAKEMKLLMQLQAQPHNAQQLGIWANRQGLYQQALRRLKPIDCQDWPHVLRRCDEAIKGWGDEQPWDLLLQIALALAGVRLFAVG